MSRCIKRVTAFILTFVLLAGLCESMTITVYAESSEFTIDRNGVLTGYHGVGGNVIVPEGVISIGKKAFSGCNNVVTVKLPSSVKTIEESAFDSCNELTGITLSQNLESIENSAFWGCKSLKSVQIPDSVTSIGFGAFCNCDSLNDIYLSKNVTSIGNYAFGFYFSGGYKPVAGFSIMGINKSSAQSYADKYSIPFLTKSDLKTTLSSVTKKTSSKMTVKWKENTKVTGYQIQYSTSNKFAASKCKTVTVKENITTSKTIASLTKGKTYYVRIRGYRTIGGKTYYSAWGKAKKVTL